jgi:DNA-binding transcriptional regulator YdaS (Cro superfamily)
MLSMKKETAIAFAGNANKLAKLLGINRSAISQWGDDVPEKRVKQLKNLKPNWFDTLVAPI